MTEIPTYPNNGQDETTLLLGTTGDPPVLVTQFASVHVKGGNKIDGQTAGGSNKARVKFKGLELTRVVVSFVLLPEDEDAFWTDTFTLLKMPGERGLALPLDITNATVNRAGVTTIVIDDYNIEQADPVHGRSVSINMREWSAAVFDPKADPNKGKGTHQAKTGPHLHFADKTLEGTSVPRDEEDDTP